MCSKLRTFKDLIAWQKGYALSLQVYAVSKRFPQDERFGLARQVQRSSVSVPSNMAEGYNRGTTKDYVRFLRTASGSLGELETQLMLCRDLELGPAAEIDRLLELVDEVGRLLKALIRSLREKMRASEPVNTETHDARNVDPSPVPLDPRTLKPLNP